MEYKKQRQLGVFFIFFGVLVLLVSSLAYFKFSSTISTDPYTTVQLDLSSNEAKKTTDLIYLKKHEKNGIPIEIRHRLKNTGDRDIGKITLESTLRKNSGHNEGQFVCLQSIKYGDQLYTLKSLKFLGLDLNKDGEITLAEFSRRPFQLGRLDKGKERDFVLNGECRESLASFTHDNQSARVILDISYKIE